MNTIQALYFTILKIMIIWTWKHMEKGIILPWHQISAIPKHFSGQCPSVRNFFLVWGHHTWLGGLFFMAIYKYLIYYVWACGRLYLSNIRCHRNIFDYYQVLSNTNLNNIRSYGNIYIRQGGIITANLETRFPQNLCPCPKYLVKILLLL